MTHASAFNGSSEVHLTGQLDGRVLVSLRCPGPARLEATSVRADQLRAALDEVAPAGSYTRTTSPDLMDGGVTSAAIEEEAERPVNPEGDAAFWRAQTEKAEQERDEALRFAAEQIAEAQAEATAAVTAKEKAEQERDAAQERNARQADMLAQPRPLTPDDITDEMRDRAYRAVAALSVSDWDDMSGVAKGRAMALVEAVITEITRPEPPTRPEGAEEIEADMAAWYGENGMPVGGTGDRLADHLAAMGYRKADS